MPVAYVIDDNRVTADSLTQWLGLLSYEAHALLGPRPALEALAQHVPDLIFLDIHMQGMDGVEVCRYIRRDPRLSGVPVVAISTDTQPGLIERARAAGANGFLAKPMVFADLEEVLTTPDNFEHSPRSRLSRIWRNLFPRRVIN